MTGVGGVARNWWAFVVRGLAAIAFGLLALFAPQSTFLALIILFGIYAAIDGVFALVATLRAVQAHERWRPLLIEGVVGVAIAVITLFEPRVTGTALYLTVAIWALLTGGLEIVAAFRLREHLAGELLLLLGGLLSILFGVLLLWNPFLGLTAVVRLIGFYALLFGGMLIGLGLRLRGHDVA